MFNADKTLRGKNQVVDYTKDQVNEIIKCSSDVIYFAENYFTIISLNEGKQKIKLYEFQKKMLKVLIEPPDGKRNCCICASRQIGKTTITGVYVLWCILFKKEFKIGILANKEKTAREILSRIQLAYSLLPLWMQVGILEFNKSTIKLENLSEVLASSTSSSAIRGFTMNELILDEFAFVSPTIQNELTSSVLPIISSGKKSKVIILSTPNGMNLFFSIFTDAVRGLNNYYPVKVLWNEIPGRDQAWKDNMLASLPGKELQWIQEFECRFFGASNTLVSNDALEKIIPKTPIEFKFNGLVQIYEEPIKGKKYIISCDPSSGTGKNYSVIQIIKVSSMKSLEQVAVFRSNMISPYDLCKYIIDLSEYYNNALVVPENNSDVGGIVCSQLFYQHEFERMIFVKGKAGIRSDKQSKSEGNYLLKRYIEHGWIKLNDRTTLYELSLYKEQSIGCFACDNNLNDDCVTSLLWALYALHLSEVSQEYFDDEGNVFEGDGGGGEGSVAFFD